MRALQFATEAASPSLPLLKQLQCYEYSCVGDDIGLVGYLRDPRGRLRCWLKCVHLMNTLKDER
jgi:hypothetical protein